MGYEEGELELEQGEAASGGGGGRELVGPGPDALANIDERIQNVLGHLRKKFEGEITHTNLGSMYGCHGSFLPTYPRSPLGFPQYRNTADPKNHGSASRSPNVPTENVQKNHFVKIELDSSRKNEYCRISSESDGNPSQQMLNRAVNGFVQKAPKIRIKVNSNKSMPGNTAAIYSGLGLDISPSSSTEDNLDETAGALVPEVLSDESPRTIFEIMTCHLIPGGHLLSPLTGNVLELRQKPKVMVKQEAPEFQVKVGLHGDLGYTTSATLDNKDKCTKEIKSDEKNDRTPNFRSSKSRVNKPSAVNKGTKPLQDALDDTGSNFLPTIVKTEPSVEDSAKFTGGISDKMKGPKNGPSKGHFSDKNKNSKEESSLDHGFSCKNRCDSDVYNDQPCASSSQLQNIPNKTSSLERDKGNILHMEDEPSQYKSKENGGLFSADSMAVMVGNADRNSLGMMKGNKKKFFSPQVALSGKKLKFKAKKQLKDNMDRKSYGEDEDYALDRRVDLANSYPIDKSVRLEKKTMSSGEIGNKSDVGNGGDLNISAMFDEKSDPLPLVCRNGTMESSATLPAPEPILINEQWVCCDKCENWRLLPYGMNPDILPKKWLCSMQSWLPGMNSCKITEDETTRSVRALYMVPAPENNIKDGGHDNAIAPTFQGNVQSISSLGKLKGSLDGANVENTLDSAGMSKLSKKLHAPSRRDFPKLKEKRKLVESSDKGEIIGKDQSHRMRSSVGVDHDNLRASKKMKKESNGPVMKHQLSEFEISKSSPASKTPKNIQKRSGISPGMGKYGLSSSGKHSHGEDKGFSDVIKTSDTENFGPRDSSIKKRKLKQRQSKQHDLDPRCSYNDTNGITKQNFSETNAVKRKTRPELKLSKTYRTATDSRGTVAGVDDGISTDKECLSEQLQKNTYFQHPSLSEDTTKRKIGHAQTCTAATSSSSTVTENVQSQESGKKGSSCSNRNYDLGSDCDKAKVRSSGCFNGDMGHHDQKNRDLLKDKQDMNACIINKGSGLDIRKAQLNPEHKVNPDVLSSHDNHDHKHPTGRQNGKTPPHFGSNQGDHANLTYGNIKADKGNIPHMDQKTNPSAFKGSKQQPSLNNASNVDASYKAKQIEKAVIKNLETRKQVTLNGDVSNLTSASVLLKEARDLKHLSKRLKEKGDDFESTSMCFEAGLKFLHVASLWEAPNVDSSKQGDSVQAMKLYSETGNLCGFCAHEFERLKKMANAALAYKCVEVAYMKAAFFKSPGVIKDRHALQAASLMVTPAESPSSSASDIDNLNSQSTVAKAVSARGAYSPQIASNPISRNNHHLMGLLSYAEDINNAFEGARKSQTSFSAYLSGIGKNQVDEVALVRDVLDFSFHNVKGLLQLIRHSLESINHESGK